MCEAFAKGSIADLIVVLQEIYECTRWQMCAWLPACMAFVRRSFALVGEAIRETAAQQRMWALRIIDVIAVRFTRRDDVQTMMDVVVPLRVECVARAGLPQETCLIRVVLEDEMNRALAARPIAHRTRELGENVRIAVIVNGMHRIESQAVEMVFLQPVECVVDEEIPYRAAAGPIEIDRGAPRRLMTIREELRRVSVQVIAFGPEVVVDHIEHHAELAGMCGGNQVLQFFGSAISRLGGVRQDAVVPPTPSSGKIRERHKLDEGDAELHEVIELLLDGGESAFRRECAYVQLVNDGLVPRPTAPGSVRPFK